MRFATLGLAAILAGFPLAGAGAEDMIDEIQDEEQPGSQIEAEIGGGEVVIGRERNMPPAEILPPSATTVPPSPVIIEGQPPLNVPNDPDVAVSPDAIDAELPGEGPENLSGPDDDDDLPE